METSRNLENTSEFEARISSKLDQLEANLGSLNADFFSNRWESPYGRGFENLITTLGDINTFLESSEGIWNIKFLDVAQVPFLESRRRLLALFSKSLHKLDRSRDFQNMVPYILENSFPILSFLHGNSAESFTRYRTADDFICIGFMKKLERSVSDFLYIKLESLNGIIFVGKGQYPPSYEPLDYEFAPANLYGKKALVFLKDIVWNGKIFYKNTFYSVPDSDQNKWLELLNRYPKAYLLDEVLDLELYYVAGYPLSADDITRLLSSNFFSLPNLD